MKLVSIPPAIERLATTAMNAAYEVHKAFGPGLLENACRQCVAFELERQGVAVEQENPMPVVCHGARIDGGYRLDLLLDGKRIVESKAVEDILPVHQAQLITCLKLALLPLGLLINFNVPLIKNGIHRALNHDFQQEVLA